MGTIVHTVEADPEPTPPVPPMVLSRMQLRRQLLRMDRTDAGDGTLLDEVHQAVEAAKATGTLEGRDLWEYWNQTSEFHRTIPH